MASLLALPWAFIVFGSMMAGAVVNPGHMLNNGHGTFGCERSKGLGWKTGEVWGGQYDRPRCVKDGAVVWCDEVCSAARPKKCR
jgi:hypothetical protein